MLSRLVIVWGADAGSDRDPELERVRRRGGDRAASYRAHLEAFRTDPDRFASEYRRWLDSRAALEPSPDGDPPLELSQSSDDDGRRSIGRPASTDAVDSGSDSSGGGRVRTLAATLCGIALWIGDWIPLFVLSLLAKLVPAFVAAVALVVFFVALLLLDPVVSLLGLSERAVAAVVGIGVIAGVWIVGIAIYRRLNDSSGDD